MDRTGCFSFVLHSHLPYLLSHGRWPHGTDWLNESLAESYLPLIDVLQRLVSEGVSPKVTIGMTPILAEQLSDPEYKVEFLQYLDQKIRHSMENEEEFRETGRSEFVPLARVWREHYSSIKCKFLNHDGDILGALRRLQDEGHIEVITSAATHAYLPLLRFDSSISAQIRQGVMTYRRHFGREPMGIWLPECGYRPGYDWSPPVISGAEGYQRRGIEEFLGEMGLKYFVVDTHVLKGGKPTGTYLERFEALKRLWGAFLKGYGAWPQRELSPYNYYLVSEVAVFTRDPVTALQVWSGERGYPGDGWYLDFHKRHHPGGLRYWRVTSSKADLADKQIYQPEMVKERLSENAAHFKGLVMGNLRAHLKEEGRPGIVCAPYDTELFGHWWFEGPEWLYLVLKMMAQDPDGPRLVTLGEFLEESPPARLVSLPEGSWGEGGFHWVWLNEWNEWTWRRIYEAEEEMRGLASKYGNTEILRQAARELLLLQSSDWQFLITTWSARDYAEKRFSDHYNRFKRLAAMARKEALSSEDSAFLRWCYETLHPFPEIDPRWFL